MKAGQVSLGGHTKRSRRRRPEAGEGQGCGRGSWARGHRRAGGSRGQEDLPGPQRCRTRSGQAAGSAFHQEERPSLDSQVHEHPPAPKVTQGAKEGAGG